MVNSNVALPLGADAGGPNGSEAEGQCSFERLNNSLQMPPSFGGRSVSHEEGLVAIALLGCAGKRPPSRSSAGRVDSGAWEELLSVGGENVRDLALGGRVHPDVANASESNGTSINDPKAQRQRQEQEQQQHLLEMEELAGSMPKLPPFGDIARSHSSNNSRSSSRKARFLSRNADSASIWPTMSTDSANLYSLIHYKNSSGSGSSGGGGPSREGGGRDATANAGGGRSSGSSGGGASWERAPSGYPAALSSSAGAGGATMTHDGEVITSNSCSSNNGKFGYAPHPLREQSFQPDRPIADLPSAKDICPDQPVSGPAATSGGGVQDWEKAAAVATSTTTSTTPSSTAASVATNGSGFFVARDHENAPAAAISACPPSSHGNHNNHVNAGGPIAPAPAPRLQPAASTRPPPAPVEHERKPSYNLLAMMIPDISKFGGPPTGAPLHAPGAVPGAAPGGAGFPAARGFAPAASAHLSPVDSYLRVGFEGDRTWTRQGALARYRRKKKRRHLVKIMRENDPALQEQNEARKRPRDGGKFTKQRPDFVSICEVQKAAKSRSSSGELPLRESTPPPQPSTRRGGGAGRSARAKSQAAAGTRASTRGGGAQEGSKVYMLTPSEAAKLGLK